MSNPWSQAYEDLRKPYLEGKMAKKDYDGDGKIESGTDEYMGSKDKEIKKAMGKKVAKEHHQKDADGKVIEHEDTTPSSVEENVDEMITLTKGDYASRNVAGSAYSNAAKKKFDSKIYKAGGGLGSNFLPLANSHEPEGDTIEEKKKDLPTTKMYRKAGNLSRDALSKGLDSKEGSKAQDRSSKIVSTISTAKEKERFSKMKTPAAQLRNEGKKKMIKKESLSDWRSDFIWEDGDSVKKT